MRIPRIYDAQFLCFADISTDQDQVLERSMDAFYEAPQPKMEFSEPLYQHAELGEMSMADLEPVNLEKVNIHKKNSL